jgi:hypothetical protein
MARVGAFGGSAVPPGGWSAKERQKPRDSTSSAPRYTTLCREFMALRKKMASLLPKAQGLAMPGLKHGLRKVNG